ncbi:Flocculation suppression protein [Rhodotorula toruloides]
MLTDELNEPWIAFSNSGDTFNVFDPDTFAQNVLPRYFRHRNFQSFVRQLNLYNFRKVLAARSVPRAKSTKGEQEAWEFHNPDFHRDRPDDVHLIKRRVSTGPSPTRSRRNSEAVLGRPSLSNVAHLSDYQLPVRPASAYGSQSSSQTATNDERASSSSPFAIPFVPPAGADPPRPHPRRQPSYPPSTLPRGRSRTAPSPTSLGPSHPAKSTPRRPFTARTPDELDPILIERKSLHSTVKKYRFDLGVLSYQVREGQARMWSLLQLTWQLKQLVKQLGGERELANFPFHVFDPRLADFSIPLSVIENDFASKSTAQAAYAFPQPHPADSSVATVYPSSHPVAQPTAMCAHEVAVPPTTVPSGLTVPASSPHTRSHSAPEQGIRRYESYESAYSLPESQLGFDQSTDFAYEPTESIVEDSWLSAYLADPPSQYSSRSASSLGEASIATSGRSSYSESSSPASSFIEVPMHDTYDAHLAYSTLGQALQGG